jgi:hypothetical protein
LTEHELKIRAMKMDVENPIYYGSKLSPGIAITKQLLTVFPLSRPDEGNRRKQVDHGKWRHETGCSRSWENSHGTDPIDIPCHSRNHFWEGSTLPKDNRIPGSGLQTCECFG